MDRWHMHPCRHRCRVLSCFLCYRYYLGVWPAAAILDHESCGPLVIFTLPHLLSCRYLGGWPRHMRDLPPGRPSVVDVTCELPRAHNMKYAVFPVWDTRGATEVPISYVNGGILTSSF